MSTAGLAYPRKRAVVHIREAARPGCVRTVLSQASSGAVLVRGTVVSAAREGGTLGMLLTLLTLLTLRLCPAHAPMPCSLLQRGRMEQRKQVGYNKATEEAKAGRKTRRQARSTTQEVGPQAQQSTGRLTARHKTRTSRVPRG
jgi:hypothetical protein